MTALARARAKKASDQVLNLSELARLTGYYRGTLAALQLPLVAGKITYTDFRRVLRQRQNAHEKRFGISEISNQQSEISHQKSASSPAADDRSPQAIADRFDAPSSRNAKPAASRRARATRPRGTA